MIILDFFYLFVSSFFYKPPQTQASPHERLTSLLKEPNLTTEQISHTEEVLGKLNRSKHMVEFQIIIEPSSPIYGNESAMLWNRWELYPKDKRRGNRFIFEVYDY